MKMKIKQIEKEKLKIEKLELYNFQKKATPPLLNESPSERDETGLFFN